MVLCLRSSLAVDPSPPPIIKTFFGLESRIEKLLIMKKKIKWYLNLAISIFRSRGST
jgi:hypothetical protein